MKDVVTGVVLIQYLFTVMEKSVSFLDIDAKDVRTVIFSDPNLVPNFLTSVKSKHSPEN